MLIAFGKGKYGVNLVIQKLTFKQFAKLCSKCEQGSKYSKYFLRGGNVKRTKGIRRRNNESLISSSVIVIDADSSIRKNGRLKNGAPAAKLAHNALKKCNLNHFIYTTHSHSESRNRWRVVIPCKIDRGSLLGNQETLKSTYSHIINLLNKHGCNVSLAQEGLVWSQPWYMPTRDNPQDGLFQFLEYHNGKVLKAVKGSAPAISYGKRVQSAALPDTVEDLMEQIESGEHIYTPIRKLIWMLMQDGVSPEFIRQLILSYLNVSPLKQSDSKRWNATRNQIDNLISGARKKTKPKEEQKQKIELSEPLYPKKCILQFPEPLSFLFRQFRKLSYDPNNLLLHPTFITFHSYLLQGKFRTPRNRRPNMLNLTLAVSTGGKDTNSGDILEDVCADINGKESLLKESGLFPFGVKTHGITGDTAFLETVNQTERNGNFMWTNTEATSIFEQLRNSEGFNSHAGALQDLLNEVSDGRSLSHKRKSGNVIEGHANPNVHCNFYAQIDTVFKNISLRMLQGGMLGRNDVLIDYSPVKLKSTIDITRKQEHLDQRAIEFYRFALKHLKTMIPKTVKLTKRAEKEFRQWEKQHIIQAGKKKDNEIKLLWGRVVQSGEKLYTVIHGWQVLWAKFNGQEPEKQFDLIECIFPYLEYQLQSREFMVLKEMSSASIMIEDAIMNTVKLLLNRKDRKYRNFVKHGMIPKSLIWMSLKNRTNLQAKVQGDYRTTVLAILESMIREGSLIQDTPAIDNCKTICVGIP